MSRWDMFVSTLAAGFGWRFALRMALEVSTMSTPNVFVCGRCGKRFEWTCSNASANQKNATDE